MTLRKENAFWLAGTVLVGFLALLCGIWLGAAHNYLLAKNYRFH